MGLREGKRARGLRGNQEAAHGLQGPSSPMPPMQPDSSLEASGQRRRSALYEAVRYHPAVMLRVAVVVPTVGQVDPIVQASHATSFAAGLLS